jgi:ABC-type arginine/histidine transport system permease subunit
MFQAIADLAGHLADLIADGIFSLIDRCFQTSGSRWIKIAVYVFTYVFIVVPLSIAIFLAILYLLVYLLARALGIQFSVG